MAKPEDVVRRYYEAFNARDLDAYAKLFTSDCRIEAPGVSARGLDSMREFDRVWIDALPKCRIESFHMSFVAGLVLTSNWMHGGKQERVLKSPAGDLPPQGGALDAPFFSIFEVDGDRISLQRVVFTPELVPRMLAAPVR